MKTTSIYGIYSGLMLCGSL